MVLAPHGRARRFSGNEVASLEEDLRLAALVAAVKRRVPSTTFVGGAAVKRWLEVSAKTKVASAVRDAEKSTSVETVVTVRSMPVRARRPERSREARRR
jgi:hypothetical protein